MRKFLALAVMGSLVLACEEIPDCAYDDSCNQILPNTSNSDFSSEPYRVLTMKNRGELNEYYQVSQVQSPYLYPAGTIVVDTPNRLLYLIEEKGLARRYPIAVGKEGYQFQGQAQVGRKVKWPLWRPTPDMFEKNPNLPEVVEGGAKNPLGSRAIYLYDGGRDTLYRIHGNNEPRSIGHQASSGCIRMYNEDVIDLYDRVNLGTNVVVVGLKNVPEGVEVDIIGKNEEPLKERELSNWEQLFYNFKSQGASDETASDKANEGVEELEVAKKTGEEFDLAAWFQQNSQQSESSELE